MRHITPLRIIGTVLLTYAAFAFIGCSAPERSKQTLQKMGFTQIETTGYAPLACGEDDTFSTSFKAVNSQGQRVSGVVCCGFFVKQCTIRF